MAYQNYQQNNGGFNGGNGYGQQNQQGQNQNRESFTAMIYDHQIGNLADLTVTMVLGIHENLNFNKFLSKNGNECVRVRADVALSDDFVTKFLGQNMLKPEKKYSLQFILAGYTAERFLKSVPNCTKQMVFMLNGFNVRTFTRKDGSQDYSIGANCIGMQIIHSSSRYKPSEVKNCNLQPSAPFTVFDSTNNAGNNGGNGGYGQQPQQAQQRQPQGYGQPQGGYSQPGTFNPQVNIPGVTSFAELDNDEDELPF